MTTQKTFPLVFNDVAVLCENDQASLLNDVLTNNPVLTTITDINDRTLLHHAAESGSWGCVEALVGHGAQVDAVDVSGETPLHRGISRGRKDATTALLNAGANPNIRNAYGATPTLYAAEKGPDLLRILTDKGGDISVKDNSGLGIEDWAKRGEWEIERKKKVAKIKP